MTDDDFAKQIDEVLQQNTLSLLYRLERLEERSGLWDSSSQLRRLPPMGTPADRDVAMKLIIHRLEILEELYGD